ncbi:MAG: protein kinase [Planctomycetes bacterium]|nr:protein kinase [Planctomycetota bacterium]
MRAPAEDIDAPVDSTGDALRHDLASDVRPLTAAQAKFTYAGGARPLSGYTIKRAIGRGGFGEVYYALSEGGKEVALKLVRRNLDVELRGVAQCLNLKHPNLLGLYDIRTDDAGDQWVVMEYVSGPSLEDVIVAHPDGLPPAEAVAWLRGIAAGVGYLHECGIVHRDLKPGNVFCEAGLVKLGDYGLSKFISCSRRSGQTESIGTVHYMAPEIASGRYGREIDVYGLGVILYEMLTGRVPFEGESVAEVLMKHLTTAPDLAGIAEPFRSILRQALAKDPAQRFSSVAAMIDSLPEGEMSGVGYQASAFRHQPSAGEPLGVSPRRHGAGSDPASSPDYVNATVLRPENLQGLTPPARQEAASILQPAKPTLWQLAAEEPIFRGVRRSLAGFGAAWKEQFSTPTKFVMILASIWALIVTGGAWVPLLMALGILYGIYFCLYMLIRLSARSSPTPTPSVAPAAPIVYPAVAASAPTARPATAPPVQATRRQRWHGRSRPALVVKSIRQRLAELFGSMVVSALASLVMTLVMFLLRGEQAAPDQFAWVALVSIAGAWGVLIPAKFWEGTDGEPVLRRFTMLIVGLLVGVAAWQTSEMFTMELQHEFTSGPAFSSQSMANQAAPLSLMTCLTYFGFLFMLIRWWRLADPLRSTRLSLWTTAVCVTCAMALYMFWPFPQKWAYFPQPWGFLVTAVIALAVQLASPWQKLRRT